MSGNITYSFSILNDPQFSINQLLTDNWQDQNGNAVPWNSTVDASNNPIPTGFPRYVSGGLACDGTVYISSADLVCGATVTYTITGTDQYDQTVTQNIMNVPFQDAVRIPLYIIYFVNNQITQITGTPPTSITKSD